MIPVGGGGEEVEEIRAPLSISLSCLLLCWLNGQATTNHEKAESEGRIRIEHGKMYYFLKKMLLT